MIDKPPYYRPVKPGIELGPMLTAGLRYRGYHLMELLIAHQVNKGVALGRMSITSYLQAGRTDLVIDDEIVITRYTAIHYMEDSLARANPKRHD